MIQPMIVIPSLILIVIQSVGSWIIIKVGQEKRIFELKILGVSFFFLSSLTFTSLIFEFFKDHQYITLARNLQIFATILTVFAIASFWSIILYLNGTKFELRYLLIAFLLPFSTGMMMISLTLDLSSTNDWIVTYSPKGGILLFGLAVNWALFEVSIIYWRGYKQRQRDSFYSFLIFLSQIVAILSAIVAIAEQTFLGGQTRYYFILNAIGALLFSYSIWKSPTSIISPAFNLSFIIVSHKDSGVLIHSKTFNTYNQDILMESVDKNAKISSNTQSSTNGSLIDEKSRYHLFSSAMYGMLQLINELTLEDRTTRTFSFNNMEIMVEEGSEITVILVANREYKFLRDSLKSFTREITQSYNFGSIVNFDQNFHTEVDDVINHSFGQFDIHSKLRVKDSLIVKDK